MWQTFSPTLKLWVICSFFATLGFIWIGIEEYRGIKVHYSKTIYNGYWGEITSNIDFCEENYEISYYVAEFFNAISSFVFCIIPFIAYWEQKKLRSYRFRIPVRFFFVYLATILLGIGSFLFHASLKRTAQLLDESPMLFGCIAFIELLESLKAEMIAFQLLIQCLCL